MRNPGPVLVNPFKQIKCHTNIQCAIAFVRENIVKTLLFIIALCILRNWIPDFVGMTR